MKKILLSFLIASTWFSADCQINGGDHIYEFLNLSSSARVTGLGGNLITVRDDDVALAYGNPSLLNPAMNGALTFQHSFMFEGIGHGYAGVGHYFKKWETTGHLGIQYLNYGDFNATDEIGNVIGTFDAGETAITLGMGKELYERLSVGANVKVISSSLENYDSWGLVGDLALTFHDTASRINVVLVAKNIGTQLSTYREGNNEPIPFEMQIGISKRLRYLPFRFSLVYHNLQKWNLLYDDPNTQDNVIFFDSDQASGGNDFFDNLFRHMVFSGEFLFGKRDNFRIRLGYNHLKKTELSVKNVRSLTGFSFGVGFKVSKFRLDYGQSFHHLAGKLNHIGISTNFGEFKKKRKR
jgi:hypothetical protein